MRRQIKRVVATLLTASLIAPMCYGNKVSNAEMVKKNVTATAVDEAAGCIKVLVCLDLFRRSGRNDKR